MVVKPVFPSYVFVLLSKDTHGSPLNHTTGCKYVLSHFSNSSEYRQPYKVPWVEDLRRLRIGQRQNGAATEAEEVIAPGTMVRIKKGMFVDTVALVSMTWKARVQLLLECFGGREVSVILPTSDVELVAAPVG